MKKLREFLQNYLESETLVPNKTRLKPSVPNFARYLISILLLPLLFFTACEKRNEVNYLFYQPLLKDKIEWKRVLPTMHSFGMKILILQWSRYDVVDFMKHKGWLEEILKEAKFQNIRVVVGLYGDNKYFKNIENKRLNLSTYFETLYKVNIQQAKEVYSVAKSFPNFSGWYFTEEVDDLNFKDKKREEALKVYFARLSKDIKKVANKPIYLSGFYGQNSSPKEYAEMLNSVVPKGVHLLLQSGVGAKLVKLDESKSYMQEFKKSYKGQFTPIVELFTINKKEIVAMEFSMIKKQIEFFRKNRIGNNIALFSLRYLFTDKLLTAYKNYKKEYAKR